ncbi:hypothetical protein [Burkholderia mallei]|uniref:hypothetical protein n=1 Tax=Burkholderia mallei TaxID=13373 RepID=UPI0012FD67E3|nr:hypothetical protein [Burkholderia mallei]
MFASLKVDDGRQPCDLPRGGTVHPAVVFVQDRGISSMNVALAAMLRHGASCRTARRP